MLLLHTCCADCALKIIPALEQEFSLRQSEITLYFYNPNIHPESEFHARRHALQTAFADSGYPLIIAPWQPVHFFKALQNNSTPAIRCPRCWQLRLTKSFEYAKDNGFQAVSTTLLSSKYHDMEYICKLGQHLAFEYSLKFFAPKTINKDMSNAGFYKQNYSGCVYSLLEKMKSKYVSNS